MSRSIRIRRSFIIAVAVLVGSIAIFKFFASLAKKSPVLSSFQKVSVLTAEVSNKTFPLNISLSGKLVAKNRIDLFAEVNGVLRSTNFREGTSYGRGQVVAKIDDRELRASLKSQKSVLLNSLSQIMPDMAIDYPEEVDKWKEFHKQISFETALPDLPATESEALKLFLSARGIYTSYYNVESQEQRLNKFLIVAPFSGTLSEAMISPGALVRAGQKLGTLIQPGSYELEASASMDDLNYIKVGDGVDLTSEGDGKALKGSILRINKSMDPSTQTVKVYIGVQDASLREGQYLKANIVGATLANVAEIPRQLLISDNKLYIIENDSLLSLRTPEIVYRGVETVYINGLSNGELYLNQALNSAYEGMIVRPITNTKSDK